MRMPAPYDQAGIAPKCGCGSACSASSQHSFHCAARPEVTDCSPAAVKTLHRHVTRQVIASLLMAMVVFTFVLLLGNVLKEILTWLINRQATLGLVVEAVGLLVPFVWVFALPMAMLTSVLLVFGRFSADQEFTAIRASGISLLSVITPVLLISLLLCAVSALVNLEIAPRCRVAYVNLRFRLVAGLTTALLPEDHVVKDFPGYIFFVGRNENGNLRDVMVF